jgi:glycosyltransferase involved in cell wall biosynthesis
MMDGDMPGKQLKIFVSAYACEPHKGSEPGIGWNFCLEMSHLHQVHVLTRANNQASIEAFWGGGSHPGLFFHYYDLPKSLSFWKHKRRGYRLYYYLWQIGAYLQFRHYVNHNGFDFVHHLTFANISMPSLFMLAKPITVWGPVGHNPIPSAIFRALPWKIYAKEKIRQFTMWCMGHFEPCRVLTQTQANWILETQLKDCPSFFSKPIQPKVLPFPQTGINTAEPEYRLPGKQEGREKIRLVICSELLHWKGVTFAAEVFSRIAACRADVELVVYGSGPEKKAMQRLFCQYGVSGKVEFKGFVGKHEMLVALHNCDILLYPSYHHGLATVILQAMYVGLPILAMAGDAIASTVDDECGLVAVGGSLEDLEKKALMLINDPQLRIRLGSRGQEMIKETYEWRKMVKAMDGVYQHILTQS